MENPNSCFRTFNCTQAQVWEVIIVLKGRQFQDKQLAVVAIEAWNYRHQGSLFILCITNAALGSYYGEDDDDDDSM